MKIKPLGDKVLIEIEDVQDDGQAFKTTASGIIVSKASEEKEAPEYLTGTVIDISKDLDRPTTLKKKDKVLFGKYSNQEIKQDNSTVYLTPISNIIAVVEK